ncbi:hypothetical protein D3C71_1257560 [compost metagenome]
MGACFKILKHHKEECVGQVRQVQSVKTVGVYTVVKGEPEHPLSKANGGQGSYMVFEKASHYTFGESIKWYMNKEKNDIDLVMEFIIF